MSGIPTPDEIHDSLSDYVIAVKGNGRAFANAFRRFE